MDEFFVRSFAILAGLTAVLVALGSLRIAASVFYFAFTGNKL